LNKFNDKNNNNNNNLYYLAYVTKLQLSLFKTIWSSINEYMGAAKLQALVVAVCEKLSNIGTQILNW
jgi:hypothetical protein